MVEAHEYLAAFRFDEMQRIGKIHALLHPIQRLCNLSGIFEPDTR